MSRYQAILQVYEAQNALGIARTAGAEQYAADVFAKAQEQFQQAQQLQNGKGNDDRIVQYARAATEIAEDARIIAERHQEEEIVLAARRDTVAAEQAKLQAQVTAQKEHERADNAQAQAQAEHEARERAELEARMARERAETATAVIVQTPAPAPAPQPAQTTPPVNTDNAAKEERGRLLQHMDSAMMTRDTPRGLDATLTDADFSGGQLKPSPANAVAQLAVVLMAHPGLRVTVEGNCDSSEGSGLASERANAVAAALVRAGVPRQQVSSMSAGNSRLLVSNATEHGRMENRRVEILVNGDAIGTVPSWETTYPLSFNREKK
jgi:flagellar motor protein MotB